MFCSIACNKGGGIVIAVVDEASGSGVEAREAGAHATNVFRGADAGAFTAIATVIT